MVLVAAVETCTAEFLRLARQVGGIDCAGDPIVTLKSPFTLDHWTMPLLEATMIVGAIACLVHAVRRKRATGDASNLVVWWAGILSLVLIEPITYFPQWFGLEEELGLQFVHNQFSVQFFYNRLPLYIVALYPMFACLTYALVQRTGVFQRRDAVVSAVCVAFTFHVLYEIFDMIGPQMRWWVWNSDLDLLKPAVGVVPYSDLQAFAFGVPLGIALLTRLVGAARAPSGRRIVAAIVLVSLGTWPVMFITSIPATLLDLVSVDIETARIVGTWLILSTAGLITAWALADAYRARTRGETDERDGTEWERFPLVAGVSYLIILGIVWIQALPAYLEARNDITPEGDPIGSLPYAIGSAAISIAILVAAYRGRAARVSGDAVAHAGKEVAPT